VPHFVYILRCADGLVYIGVTADLAIRLALHQAGEASGFTRRRRPVSLVYAEEWPTRIAACHRERQLKRWTRAKKEALIAGNPTALKGL
jgi:predicted GIY-YIG superfamily endonuclease